MHIFLLKIHILLLSFEHTSIQLINRHNNVTSKKSMPKQGLIMPYMWYLIFR